MSNIIENQYNPEAVSPPGDTLLETLEYIGMTQSDFAERTGRPKKTISEIIQGNAAITAETALQFESVLGTPASFWLNRERHYRESLARHAEQVQLSEKIEWLKTLPIAEMCKRGWIRRLDSQTEQLKEALAFFGVASPEAWENIWRGHEVAFRKSQVFESDPGAVAAWLRKGQIDASKIDCSSYSATAFKEALLQIRTLTTLSPDEFQPKLIELCAKAGVAVVFTPELPKSRVLGATQWLSSDKALIQLSLRYKSNDHLWFTFFHEAGHIYKHGKKEAFVETAGESGDKEKEADQFAANVLLPSIKYRSFTQRRYFSKADVIAFSRQIGVDPGIVVGRLQHDKLFLPSHLNGLKKKYEWANE
jgi:addiction module HigA family antidote